jgi:hypothetical protein
MFVSYEHYYLKVGLHCEDIRWVNSERGNLRRKKKLFGEVYFRDGSILSFDVCRSLVFGALYAFVRICRT